MSQPRIKIDSKTFHIMPQKGVWGLRSNNMTYDNALALFHQLVNDYSGLPIIKLRSTKYQKLSELAGSGDILVTAKTDKGLKELMHVLGNMKLED